MKRILSLVVGLAIVAAAAGVAAADGAPGGAPGGASDDVPGFALVVGSNAPGPGQEQLVWAEDDAREVAELLEDLGGFEKGRVKLVLKPTAATLMAEVAALEKRVKEATAGGQKARVVFYYSGHAKANALSLGSEELELATLRARLFAVPATLTVVVLDACQSGAFSRTKGVEAAEDFSFNSRSRLDAQGVAVLASSTGSELSQESDFLRSSYFTHHLLVGLRGAADDNDDGRVSLDEAYRYTYHHTLTATAATAVGSQHVSVEVDLKGQGEIPLSYPQKATTTITLPAAAEGQVLVERLPARAVVAEVQKARGTVLAIAVAPGRYQVMVRGATKMLRCSAAPGRTPITVDLSGCRLEALVDSNAKGGGGGGVLGPKWHVTALVGIGGSRHDGYIDRLEDFGYHRQNLGSPQLGVHVVQRIHPNVLIGGEAMLIGGEEWRRDTEAEPLRQKWDTLAFGAIGRVETRPAWRFVGYGQIGAGLALGITSFTDELGATSQETFPGIYGAAALGVDLWLTRRWGVTTRLTGSYAPAIDNLIGDQHDGGLITVGLGAVNRR
ncbi:MAG TPA: caspase family protein [Kofleriaceae bacterium]|nr:caspase family protein [Kofleriaceae bacterium]